VTVRVFTLKLDEPLAEVFAWHERPGALTRLLPPWLPGRVVAEARSVRDGRAVVALPGGSRWIAAHDPAGYDPPRRFVDVLASSPSRGAVRWRHSHEFAADGDAGTLITDRVDTNLPLLASRAVFDYRGRQLRGDLASHAWARRLSERDLTERPLTIAMTGASGLVGTALRAFLTTGGHRVVALVRRPPRGPDERRWDPQDPDDDLLADVDVLVHLAGEPIGRRFTAAHRQRIRDSRVEPTRLLARCCVTNGVPVLVSASGVGYYGTDRGDEPLTEDSERGDGYLADLVTEWEDAASSAEAGGVRVVRVRTGVVQSPRGGSLRLQAPIFRAGIGGPVGSGRQWRPWIGIDDLLDVYLRAIVDARLSGPVNATAPNPVVERDYARTLGRVLHRPALLPVPAFGPKVLLGAEGARELADSSLRVLPRRLTELGHAFRFTDLDGALRHVLGRT
jgi:uncharacterized protein (TIGR01777 family)